MERVLAMGRILKLSLLAASLLLAAGLRSSAAGEATAVVGAGPPGPIVVELFTSQGCSSCPPADQLLSRLGGERALAGRLVPLAFHVDYWNHIGWADPFSSRRWSARQEAYARVFGSGQIYTPQMVIDGRAECVGSREDQVRRRIGGALAAGPPAGRVTLELAPPGPDGKLRVAVAAHLEKPVSLARSQDALDVWVALTESGLATAVGAGENAARTLHEDFVVRRLEKAFSLPAAAGASRSGAVVLDLAAPPGRSWDDRGQQSRLARLAVVAFLQDPGSLAIHGAATAALPAAAH